MYSDSFFSTDIKYLKGVGPKRAVALYEQGIQNARDLLHFYPRRYLDKRRLQAIGRLREGESATVVGVIQRIRSEGSPWKNPRLIVSLSDATGRLELTWFQGGKYLLKKFKEGDALAVWGKVTRFGALYQMTHPDVDFLSPSIPSQTPSPSDYELFNTGKIIPLYPGGDALKKVGLSSPLFRQLIHDVLTSALPLLQDHFSEAFRENHQLMSLQQALRSIHQPESHQALSSAERRLKWDELFFLQLFFALRQKHEQKQIISFPCPSVGEYTHRLHQTIPYELTAAQKRVIRQIREDMKQGIQMNRLVQGDVGSGKTLVAAYAMMIALDNGLQCAFMAPTEILATQHFLTLKRLFEPLDLHLTLIIGKQRKKLREIHQDNLHSGVSKIAVGTHALLESSIQFERLGLVIIDEQHRFGVLQRKRLQDKSHNPHILLMTATPIPRTLTLTTFGDLDVSVIDEMPKNRIPIKTLLYPDNTRPRGYELIRSEVAKGRQAYIVYPLVEESEKMDLMAAVTEYERLKNDIFPQLKMGLIHGQMTPSEKEEVMHEFRTGSIDILVGTTVIEVGVDVPNATVIAIEHAERFGLAQLHQLRGRVGRGEHQSYCALIYSPTRSHDAKERLAALERTNDGFIISEIDASLRGVGNIMGIEQSGNRSLLRLTDLSKDTALLEEARKAAFDLIHLDPQLRLDAHHAIRLYFTSYYKWQSSLIHIG